MFNFIIQQDYKIILKSIKNPTPIRSYNHDNSEDITIIWIL